MNETQGVIGVSWVEWLHLCKQQVHSLQSNCKLGWSSTGNPSDLYTWPEFKMFRKAVLNYKCLLKAQKCFRNIMF